MKYFLLLTTMCLSLVACDRPGSKLIGKWATESATAKYFAAKKGRELSKSNIIEFTATERIRNGSRESIELVNDGNDVIVYQTIFGQRVGQTLKFIDNNTAVETRPFDTITYHRLDESK